MKKGKKNVTKNLYITIDLLFTVSYNYKFYLSNVPKKAFIVNLYFHFTENPLQVFTKHMYKVILMNKYINNVEHI